MARPAPQNPQSHRAQPEAEHSPLLELLETRVIFIEGLLVRVGLVAGQDQGIDLFRDAVQKGVIVEINRILRRRKRRRRRQNA